jgi:hypothetical protein
MVACLTCESAAPNRNATNDSSSVLASFLKAVQLAEREAQSG